MTTCMMTHLPARCTLPVGHDGPHATRDGYGWHDSDDMDGGVTAALIEKEATTNQGQDRQSLIDHIQEQDRIIRKRNGQIKRMEGAEMRAEKATAQLHDALDEQVKLTRERDEATAETESLSRQLHDAQQDADMSRTELESEQPRPLTAREHLDDSDLYRARHAAAAAMPESWWGGREWREYVRDILTAALTKPPQRPEGLTRLIDTIREATYDPEPVATGEALYNAGVRVVDEERS